MKEVKSILEFDDGAVMEKLQYELNAVMENIQDINTDEKERTITIKVKLKPDEKRKLIAMTTEVTKSVRPTRPAKTIMRISMSDFGLAATEVTEVTDGQMSIDGTRHETKIIKFPLKKAE